jgi:hypothetical protein
MDNDDIDPADFVDNYYDEIIRHQTIARRTNGRMCFTSFSQREVALAATIEYSWLTVFIMSTGSTEL